MNQVPAITAQVGDEVKLLIQFVDVNGNIINLSGGSGFFINLEYPDGTAQDFPALLYTDGSDGIITYSTAPSDLSQMGYYFIQGKATVGGSTFTTRNNQINNALFIYPNVPSPTPPIYALSDPNNVVWQISILTTGNLETIPNSGVPAESLIVLKDSSGNYWQLTVQVGGNLVTTEISNPRTYQNDLEIADSTGYIWTVTVLPTGNLETN